MKLLFWEDKKNVYGGQKALLSRCLRLRERGFNFIVVHSYVKSQFLEHCTARKLTNFLIRIPAIWRLTPILEALFVLRLAHTHKITLIHLDSFSTAYPLILLRPLISPAVKIVFTIRSDRPLRFNALDAVLVRRCDAVVTNSEFIQKNIVKRTGLNSVPVHYSPIEFPSHWQTPEPEDTKVLGIGYIGSIEPRKQLDFLIRCFAVISQQAKGMRLYIAGTPKNANDTHYYVKCQELAAPLGDRVRFVGYKTPDEFCHLVEVVVCPYENEPLGRVVPEFLYRGRLVVVSDSGGMEEAALGYAVSYKHGNEASLINALQQVTISQSVTNNNLEETQHAMASFFSYRRIGDMDIDLYYRLINAH